MKNYEKNRYFKKVLIDKTKSIGALYFIKGCINIMDDTSVDYIKKDVLIRLAELIETIENSDETGKKGI